MPSLKLPIGEKGLALIKHFEGFSAKPYKCPAGHPTVGYGHVIKYAERDKFAGGINEIEGIKILLDDIWDASRAVQRLINVPLNQGQFDALVSFTFNLGAGALQRSTLRQALNRGWYSEGPSQILRWSMAKGVKIDGLVRRRRAEAALFRGEA